MCLFLNYVDCKMELNRFTFCSNLSVAFGRKYETKI